MVLKFDDFIKINEGSNESVVSLGTLKKTLKPFGWVFSHSKGGDNMKVSKGRFINNGHLLHSNSSDDNRKVDIAYLNRLRKMFIEEFKETGDLSTIKAIDWDSWRLMDPLKKELKDYNPETGELIVKEKEPELNAVQILNNAKIKKQIADANEKYKNSALWKIDNNDENSAYIITDINKFGKTLYNTCKSPEDRRPILKDWTFDYDDKNGVYYLGKDDMRTLQTKFYKVLSDGTLEKTVSYIKESKNIEKNLEISE